MNTKNKYSRIKLPYELNDLEPIVSYQTMYWHYNFFHRNYEIKLNETLIGMEVEKDYPHLEKLMVNLDKLPSDLREEVRFFGGGLINHNFFFRHLAKPNSAAAEPKIEEKLLNLMREFLQNQKLLGNALSLQDQSEWEKIKKELVKKSLKVRGSGWTWLVLDKKNKLQIVNTANQDGPWSLGFRPLIAIDVWEHAYFLDYHNNRQMYVEKLVSYLLNWEYINWLFINYSGEPSLAKL
ncbi:MAG: superoxide dismutase [Mycoplasmataceae bacterium RC_NB112A]|nr:MAG: superoxide dismutase [Mycoplasmataceae bacterium RC_NB112A]KLL01950.1 MAG: superoxide dismutase [Mycoplasmataceae bacterium RC_NB112A]